MELPAAGEQVFAVESIEKKRIRKVCLFSFFLSFNARRAERVGSRFSFWRLLCSDNNNKKKPQQLCMH